MTGINTPTFICSICPTYCSNHKQAKRLGSTHVQKYGILETNQLN